MTERAEQAKRVRPRNVWRTVGRVVASLLSQGITSITNALLVVFVARSASASELGKWSMAYAACVFVATVVRASVGVSAILSVGERSTSQRVQPAGILSVAFVPGALTALAMVGAAMVAGGECSSAFLALAAAIPAWLLQDTCRYLAIAEGKPLRAAETDAVWLVVFLSLVAVWASFGRSSPSGVTAAWAAGAWVGLGYALLRLSIRRVPWTTVLATWQRIRRDAMNLSIESVANAGAVGALPFIATMTTNAAGAGGLRAAQTVVAPLSVVISGLIPVVVRESRLRVADGDVNWRVLRIWLSGMIPVAAAYGVLLAALPERRGEALFGDAWRLAGPLLFPLWLQTLSQVFAQGAAVLLRSGRWLAALRNFSIATALLAVIVGVVAGLLWGTPGIAWALVLRSLATTCIYLTYLRVVASRSSAVPAAHRAGRVGGLDAERSK